MGNKCYVDLNTIRLSNVALGTPSGGSSSGSGNAPDSGVTLKPMEGIVKFNDEGRAVEITIPDGVTSILTRAYRFHDWLQRITIPDSVTSIGDEAFLGSGLQSATIPSGVESIGSGLFYECRKLQSVTILGGVIRFAYNAFYACENLTDFHLINFGSVNTQYERVHLENPINWSHDSMVKSLLTDSFDRASAGYPIVDIVLGNNYYKLSGEEIDAIESKGYTLHDFWEEEY